MRTARRLPRAAAAVSILSAVVALAVAASLRPEAAAGAAPPDFFGVAPQAPLADRDYELMAKDNVGAMRAVIYWPAVEIARGSYWWGEVDAVVARAAAAGVRLFPVLYGTPEWALSKRRYRDCGITCGPGSSASRDAFARFAAAAVARYGPGGDFWAGAMSPPVAEPEPAPCDIPLLCPTSSAAGGEPAPRRAAVPHLPIVAWQIWNEQNSPKYYGPRPHVRGYARLLRAAAARIRSEDAGADVVIGGMWGPRGTKAVVPTERYLKQLYRVRGVRAAADSIAVHPYAGRLVQVKAQLRRVRDVARRSGDRAAGLWVGELGWASGGPRDQPLVKSRREQASLLRRSFQFLLRKRRAWHVRGVYWYSWRDTRRRANICEWCPRSGLRKLGGAPKPAAKAFRRLAARAG